MPGGDGTGPMGMGPMTGRGAGLCSGLYNANANTVNYGRGIGCGFGCGRGFRRMSYMPRSEGFRYPAYAGATEPYMDEKTVLKRQAEILENQLNDVKRRIYDSEKNAE